MLRRRRAAREPLAAYEQRVTRFIHPLQKRTEDERKPERARRASAMPRRKQNPSKTNATMLRPR